MAITEILPGIHYVGVNDRTTTRFESLWSLPMGVSYNAYLVVGEKIALIDTVEEAFGSRLEANIREAIGDRKVDYLVVNHMEPDHSSSITALRRIYPELEIVGNAKTLQMIDGFYGIAAGTIEVREGDTLDLGGKTLSFHMIPMVHWPETMATWCAGGRTLRSKSTATGTKCAVTTPASWANTAVPCRKRFRRFARCPSRRSVRRTVPCGSSRSPRSWTSTTA